MTKRLIIAGFLIALFVGGLGVFQFVVKPELIRKAMTSQRPPPQTVTAELARTQRVVSRINAIGTLQAIKGVDIASQVAGVVTEIHLESGSVVRKGDKLVQLDTAVERADLESNIATLKQAELELKRQRQLERRGVAAEVKLEAAIAARDSAAAAVQRTRAIIAQKSIMAPFDGVLGLRKVDLGQYVSPGMSLVTLQSLDPINVDFPVPEQYIGRLHDGQTIELTVDSYPGNTFRGTIEALDARVSKETRTLQVRGRLTNPDHKLLPGMFANVRVLAGAPTDVVTVPRTAVTYSLYGDTVYVVKRAKAPAGTAPALIAERRRVTVGEIYGERVVLADGVKDGERVVTTGQIKLRPGTEIRIDNRERLAPPAERPRE